MQSLVVQRADRPVVATLAPLFALITASTIMALTYARALFLEHRPHADLPWMYVMAAVFTALCTIGYLPLMKRWELTSRFRALLGLAAVSFVGLGLAARTSPVAIAMLLFAWTAGMSRLLVMQMWSYSVWLLPIRQARHLFPLLAAAATAGAMAGGALSAAIAPDTLLYLSAMLLAFALVIVGWASQRLAEAKLGPDTRDETRPLFSTGSTGGLVGAWRSLKSTPLLRQLAWLAVALQVGSLLLDVQLSAAAKSSFDGTELAAFFGLYYAASNGLTLGLSLLGAERLTRRIGLGSVAALHAWPLLIGAILVATMGFTGAEAAALWFVILTSLGERVVTFGAARQAFGAAMTPVDAREAERARFLIEGVLVRGATVATGIVVIALGVDLEGWSGLAPAIAIAAAVALVRVRSVDRAYRQALVAGLQKEQLGTIDAVAVKRWTESEATEGLRDLLMSDDLQDIVEGLRRCEMLELAPPEDLLERLLDDVHGQLATLTLRTVAQVGGDVPPRLLLPSLSPKTTVSRLRAALLVATQMGAEDHDSLAEAAVPLRNHRDSLVRSLACALHGDPPEYYADSFEQVLQSVLSESMRPTRRTVIDAALTVTALRSDALIPSLLDAMSSARLAPTAIMALHRLSPDVVGTHIGPRLEQATRSLSERTRLLHLAEQLLQADAILPALEQADPALRHRAVEALWRLHRRGITATVSLDAVEALARREVATLILLGRVDRGLADTDRDSRPGFLRHQLALRRTDTEQQVFRLLGLRYGREAIDRAFKTYRSDFQRSRSNAIELLDATVGDTSLRALVPYIESTEHHGGLAFTRNDARLQPPGDLRASLEIIDPLMARMHAWALTDPGDDVLDDVGFNHGMDRVLLLSRISLFADTPAQELLLLAEVCQPVAYAAGEVIFKPGDAAEKLYLIERGEVEILRDRQRVVSFGKRQAFGELAIAGDAVRNTTARAVTDTDCLVLARVDFSALLDVSPSLARGAIAVLAERLRQTLERLG